MVRVQRAGAAWGQISSDWLLHRTSSMTPRPLRTSRAGHLSAWQFVSSAKIRLFRTSASTPKEVPSPVKKRSVTSHQAQRDQLMLVKKASGPSCSLPSNRCWNLRRTTLASLIHSTLHVGRGIPYYSKVKLFLSLKVLSNRQ